MFHIFIFQEFEKITGMEEEGNIISMSSKESSDAQLIHNEDTIELSDYNEVRILYLSWQQGDYNISMQNNTHFLFFVSFVIKQVNSENKNISSQRCYLL